MEQIIVGSRKRKLILFAALVCMAIVMGAEIQHSLVEIEDIKSRMPPDGYFQFTTAVEVAHVDDEGNIVDSVLKVGDLPTENFGYVFALMFSSPGDAVNLLSVNNDTVMKDVTGTQRTISALPTFGVAQQDFVDVSYTRIGWGSGSTAANFSQWELVTKDSWDTVDQFMFFKNTTHMWMKLQMSHEVSTATTVNEVALYSGVYEVSYSTTQTAGYVKDWGGVDGVYGTAMTFSGYHTSTSDYDVAWRIGTSYGQYMLFRDVLGSTVNVPANEAMTITYWIYLKYA